MPIFPTKKFLLREGASAYLYKRPRLPASTTLAAKRQRVNPAAYIQHQPEDRAPETAAITGPSPTVTHKYSVNVNSALLRKLESCSPKIQ